MGKRRWQDGLNLAVGLWLALSPLLGFGAAFGVPALDAYLAGAALVLLGAAALRQGRPPDEWMHLAVGFWLILAPFALAFSMQALPTWNHIVVGLVVAGDALWRASRRPSERPAERPRQA